MSSFKPLLLATISMLVFFSGRKALADYKLQSGDVLEMKVIGVSDLNQKATISQDGVVSFPFFGNFSAKNKTQSEVLSALRALIPGKVIQVRLTDGKQTSFVLSPDEVSLTIDEYRPVYIYGYVQHPGAIVYRPGLTVRQVVSEAGGTGIEKIDMLALTDLKADYEVALTDKATTETKLARIDAELNGAGTLKPPRGASPEISAIEQQILESDQETYQRDVDYRKDLLGHFAKQIGDLEKRSSNYVKMIAEDDKDISSMRGAFDRGSVPLLHFSELRRVSEETQVSALQSQSELDQTARDKLTAERDLKRFEEQRTNTLNNSRNEYSQKLRELEIRIAGQQEKLFGGAPERRR